MGFVRAIGNFLTNQGEIAKAQAAADQYSNTMAATSANTFGNKPIIVRNEEEARIAANQGLIQDPNNPLMFRSPAYENTQLWNNLADTKVDNATDTYMDYLGNPINTVIDRVADVANLPFSILGQGRVIPDPSARAEKRYYQALDDNTKIAAAAQKKYTAERTAVNNTLTDILTQKKQYSGIGSVQPVGVPVRGHNGLHQPMSDGSVRQYKLPDGTAFQPTRQQLVDLGGGRKGIIDLYDSEPTPNEVVDQDTYTQNVQAVQQARTTGQETAKSMVNLKTQMPTIREQVNKMLTTIENVRNHKGKKKVVGSVIGNIFADSVLAAGTDEADFMSLFNMLSGELFLAVRESLKGAGTVTDFEGMKGEQSMTGLSTTNKVETFDKRLDDLKDMLIRTLEVKENQLKGYKTTQGGNTYQVVE